MEMRTFEIYTEEYSRIVQAHTVQDAIMNFATTLEKPIKILAIEDIEFRDKNQRPTPVSDEEISNYANEHVNKGMGINEKFIPIFRRYVRNGAEWMRSRIQQPVGIEWPDMTFVNEESKEYSERYEDHLQDTAELAFREGMVSMVLELKSRVKVVDLDKVRIDFIDWVFDECFVFTGKWEMKPEYQEMNIKKLLEIYNQRTGEGRKG